MKRSSLGPAALEATAEAVTFAQASTIEHLHAAALLRASCFYEEQAKWSTPAFPARFLPAFVREFAERELRSLQLRTEARVGSSLRCTCLVALDQDGAVLACADCSLRAGPCSSDINGAAVPLGASYAYVDNVCVVEAARRRGLAKELVQRAAAVAREAYAASELLAHCHAQNDGARRLYAQLGFSVPRLDGREPGGSLERATERMRGLLLLRAPLPLAGQGLPLGGGLGCDCGARDWGLTCVCSICR